MSQAPIIQTSTDTQSRRFEAAQKSKVLHTTLVLTGLSTFLIAALYYFRGDIPFASVLSGASLLSWFSIYLNRKQHATMAAVIYTVIVYLAIFYALLNRTAFANLGLIALPAWILTVSFFFSKRTVFISTPLLILTLAFIYLLRHSQLLQLSPLLELDQLIVISVILAVTGILVWTISGLHDYQIVDFMSRIVGGIETSAQAGGDNGRPNASAETEKKLRQYAGTTADAILLLKSNGDIIFVNQAAEQIFETPSEDILGRSLAGLLVEPDSEVLREEIDRILNQQDEIQVHELQGFAIRGGEEEFPVRLSYSAWRSGPDKFSCFIVRDLTEEMETQKWLVFQERLGTLGSLVAGVAHDFNNALMPIMLNTQLMLEDQELDQSAKANLEIVLRQAKHAGELSKQLLTYSSQTKAALQPTNLKQILLDIENLLNCTFPENISLKLEARPGSYYLLGDPNRLEQAFMNLAINARDAMQEGGKLYLRLSKQIFSDSDNLPFSGMQSGEWIRLDITDTGDGILAEDIPRIFEPFFTTKDEGEGYGLGLAQTYNIVKQHQGYIDVVSRLGKGTTFTIYFPPMQGEEPIDLCEGNLEAIMGRNQTILVVEDDQESLQVLTETIEHLNYRVKAVSNGAQAIEAFMQDEIDLVISDMIMPDVDGLKLHSRLAKIDPQVKLVIISGYSLDEVSTELLENGVVGLLRKPVTMSTLAGTIYKALT